MLLKVIKCECGEEHNIFDYDSPDPFPCANPNCDRLIERIVFKVYDDGAHLGCFETYKEAEKYADHHFEVSGSKMIEIDEDTYHPRCDCKMLEGGV